MQFLSQFLIKLANKKVGEDEFGNQYFQSKSGKRFAIYKGLNEPSKIPANWHSWIHYSCEKAPAEKKMVKYSWQKIHLPNLTGTKNKLKCELLNTHPCYYATCIYLGWLK